ncbi:MAG TPA: type II secretion system major pseudopilin GspG [Acidobacteriota bacterium]|jgi:general secretion pathway protein G
MATDRSEERQRGFSLIELIVVLVILGLLAGLVTPAIMDHLIKARITITKRQISLLETALDSFKVDVGRYPATEEGLHALLVNPGNIANWNGPYLQKNFVPKDAWKREFIYRCPGQHGEFDLYSFGPDGQEGGQGQNADITSWESN